MQDIKYTWPRYVPLLVVRGCSSVQHMTCSYLHSARQTVSLFRPHSPTASIYTADTLYAKSSRLALSSPHHLDDFAGSLTIEPRVIAWRCPYPLTNSHCTKVSRITCSLHPLAASDLPSLLNSSTWLPQGVVTIRPSILPGSVSPPPRTR